MERSTKQKTVAMLRFGPADYLPGEGVELLADDSWPYRSGIVLHVRLTPLGWRYEIATNGTRHVVAAANLRLLGTDKPFPQKTLFKEA